MNSLSATASPAAARPLGDAKLVRYLVLGLLAAVLCAYSGVVRCDFITLDDTNHVTENPMVLGGLSWSGIREAFTALHAGLWVPFTWLSLMTDVTLFGLNPGAMHGVNLALHAGSTVLLFFALRRMTGLVWESAAVAALFALHPINVESVAWVTERKNVLCTFFWMLTLLVYARYAERPSIGRYLAFAGTFAAALLSKPLAVTLPCALLLLDFWPLRRHLHTSWLRLALEKLPLLAFASVSSWLTIRALHVQGQSVSLELLPFPVRISNALTSYAIYLGDLAWPSRLGVLYPHPLKVETLAASLAAVLLVGVGVFAWQQRVRRPWIVFGWCWFLGTIVPMIGLVQAGSVARADRFTYVAQVGLFITLVWSLRDFRQKRLLAGGLVVLLAILAGLTIRQVGFWMDSVALYEHTIAVTRPNPLTEALAANAQAWAGDYQRAIPHYQRSLSLVPDKPELWNDFGGTLGRIGADVEAVTAYRQALDLDPTQTNARYNLATTLGRLGQREEAIGQLFVVTQAAPDFGRAHFHLGRFLAEAGRRDEALQHLRTAAQLLPGDSEVQSALATFN